MATAIAHRNDLLRSVVIQGRVLGALVMREIITRYGRHNIGFMWVFVEPMMFTAGVMAVRTLLHMETARVALVPFIVTGYSTVLLWRNTISRCSNAIEPNRALLHHRNVRVIDLFFARLLLEIVGASTSLLLLSCLLCFTGLMMPPDDIFKMIVAWLLLAWFSMAMGLTIGSLSTRWDPVDRIWHVIAYLFLPVSGAFFMVDWLPSRLQEAAVLVPTVSCIELLREGYFGKTMHAHYELGYVVVLNTVLTLIALFSVRSVSDTVEGE